MSAAPPAAWIVRPRPRPGARLRRRAGAPRGGGDSTLPTQARQEVGHVGLMLQHHQRRDVTLRRGIALGVELAAE